MTTDIITMDESHLEEVLNIQSESIESPLSRQTFLDELNSENHVMLVAKNEKVLGYCVGQIVADELHIHSIAVIKNHRHSGIGTKLLEKLLKIAETKSLSLATLEVRTNNEKAISLYKKFNFDDVGIRPKYYRDGQDAQLMTLGLK